jgi:hypothetical protein
MPGDEFIDTMRLESGEPARFPAPGPSPAPGPPTMLPSGRRFGTWRNRSLFHVIGRFDDPLA